MAVGTMKSNPGGPMKVLKWRTIDYTGSSSYDAGGFPIAAVDFGFTTLLAVLPQPISGGFGAQYNMATGKLMLFRVGAAVATPMLEVVAAENVSTAVVRCFGIGE